MTGLAVFIALVAAILAIDRLTRRKQPDAPYLVNAASLEHARPLSADERFAGGHHREIR